MRRRACTVNVRHSRRGAKGGAPERSAPTPGHTHGGGPPIRQLVASGSPFEREIGFSRAVRIGNHVFVAGTAPLKDGKTVGPGDPAAQTRRCLEIISEALTAAGASTKDVVRTRIFLTRAEDWKAVGAVHGEFFGEVRPASTMVEVSALLNKEWLVEIEADAML